MYGVITGVITGDINANYGWGNRYPFKTQPLIPDDNKVCSALWRGYIAEFTLTPEGPLTLDAYYFPFRTTKPRQLVNERLSGDFWLLMKSAFAGNRVYVPFRTGIIVINENNWAIEGNDSLESLKHPEPERFEPKNIPIEEPVFIGIVIRVKFDELLEGYPCVVFDREIPRTHDYCEVQIRRNNAPIAETKICGNSGGGAGPWLLRPPIAPWWKSAIISSLLHDCPLMMKSNNKWAIRRRNHVLDLTGPASRFLETSCSLTAGLASECGREIDPL